MVHNRLLAWLARPTDRDEALFAQGAEFDGALSLVRTRQERFAAPDAALVEVRPLLAIGDERGGAVVFEACETSETLGLHSIPSVVDRRAGRDRAELARFARQLAWDKLNISRSAWPPNLAFQKKGLSVAA